jgi:hypothetical protein
LGHLKVSIAQIQLEQEILKFWIFLLRGISGYEEL